MVASAAEAFLNARVAQTDIWADRMPCGPLPVSTVKINAVFGGAPGGAAEPRRAGGTGFGFGPELLDEMTAVKVVHWTAPGRGA